MLVVPVSSLQDLTSSGGFRLSPSCELLPEKHSGSCWIWNICFLPRKPLKFQINWRENDGYIRNVADCIEWICRSVMRQHFTFSKVYLNQGQQTTTLRPCALLINGTSSPTWTRKPCPWLRYSLSVVAFIPQRQSWVVAIRTVCLKKPKIFTIWLFKGGLTTPGVEDGN